MVHGQNHMKFSFPFSGDSSSHVGFCVEVLTNHPVEQRLSFVLGVSVMLAPTFLPVRPHVSGFGTFVKDLSTYFKFGWSATETDIWRCVKTHLCEWCLGMIDLCNWASSLYSLWGTSWARRNSWTPSMIDNIECLECRSFRDTDFKSSRVRYRMVDRLRTFVWDTDNSDSACVRACFLEGIYVFDIYGLWQSERAAILNTGIAGVTRQHELLHVSITCAK